MPQDDSYRKVATLDLRPVYTSLGLPRSTFKEGGRKRSRIFDAALNCDPSQPDAVWLFKGSEYYRYNLRDRKIDEGPKAIAGNWGGATWPILFSSGIDAAVWGGPAYPHLWYMFKEDQFIRLNSTSGGNWVVDVGPTSITAGWASARDTWLKDGCDAAIHALGASENGRLHMFRKGEYMRHNLNDGQHDIGPVPISPAWNLPEPFSSKIDLAFYGTGDEESHIYFFSGDEVAQYDTRGKELVDVCPIEKRFRDFARFMARPQIFMVENYTIETYVGPLTLGGVIDSKTVDPESTYSCIVVTETVDSTTTRLSNSLLTSQDASTVKDFNTKMDKRSESAQSHADYEYQMNADFHGDAKANSLWGGEVNASLGVKGSTNEARGSFADSAFESVGEQVVDSTRALTQKTYQRTEDIEHKERVVKTESVTLKNTTNQSRQFNFYTQLQPTYALLILKDIRFAYGDGSGSGLETVKLSSLRNLLDEKLNSEQRDALLDFIKEELKGIEEHGGQKKVSVLASEDPPSLLRDPVASFRIQLPGGATQDISTRGLVIKAARDWLAPTMAIASVMTVSGGT